MSKESSKELFEWYAQVALGKIKDMGEDIHIFKDCRTRKEFSDYMLNIFIAYYGLRCTCDDVQDWDFNTASGHYQKCDLWKFTHIVNRCLDWADAQDVKEKKEVGDSSQE